MTKSLQLLEGVGPKHAEALRAHKCHSPKQLLEQGATKKGRKEIAEKTGIGESVILRFVNMADLFRIKGVSSQYAELLKEAGVDTVKELRNRNPANLTTAMKETNEKKKVCRQVPSQSMVEAWVTQAKSLDAVVTY
ncbi:MAG: DUF4332 domain-containing protein [Gammaproteobacteria bacterium]|nr:DUF4332 domain-containing protein [Gammaproteobacteria bacterium]